MEAIDVPMSISNVVTFWEGEVPIMSFFFVMLPRPKKNNIITRQLINYSRPSLPAPLSRLYDANAKNAWY